LLAASGEELDDDGQQHHQQFPDGGCLVRQIAPAGPTGRVSGDKCSFDLLQREVNHVKQDFRALAAAGSLLVAMSASEAAFAQ
jgi:hypothetical protein